MRSGRLAIVLGGLALLASAPALGQYTQSNLVSDIGGAAQFTDAHLMNPWGMAFSSTSPFWVSDQRSNVSTLYNALANPIPQALVVANPTGGVGPPTGATGQVFNSTASDFMIPASAGGTVKSTFLFDTLQGTIQGWNPGSTGGTSSAVTVVPSSGAVFTGLTLASLGGLNYLYAADATGHVDVFNGTFTNVTNTTFAGKFVDPNPVSGFTPFNIQSLNLSGTTVLFVTYAAATSTGAPLPGGYVDEFDTAGNFLGRIATNGPINAPWGLALAPAGWGPLGGDLLIGNLYDSVINAYNLSTPTATFAGSIAVKTGFASPVGLWALAFGNGTTGNPNTLYFTSGINDQKDGLFGSISVPEPGSAALVALGGLACAAARLWRRARGRR